MRGCCVLLLCTAFVMSVAGCSFATGSGNVSRGDLTGVWIGNLTVDHVHGQAGFVRQDISFTLLQQQSAISGFYRCWSGDKPCADFNLGGWVVCEDGFADARDAREDGGRVELLLPRCSA
jgi:hypothetical protein